MVRRTNSIADLRASHLLLS
ncbi:hypothetical protein CCGE525_36160 (plasmid) [Rhizobium jaguaris]|uniref:OAR domain-containing protein n=1 Tax=Rhizobium jaguaris TaxID=1312183 RepID=A0A387G902_9HYPH|nr:hypothetical protein CCGE525_36160 [Rhizobium jaguaris]